MSILISIEIHFIPGCLLAVGQQSGKADRASRAKHTIGHSRAHCNRAIGHLALSGQSGRLGNRANRANRAIGQSGKSGNRAIGKTKLAYMKVRTTIHFARLLTWPDWQSHDQIAHFARLGQRWVARLTHGQIGARLPFRNRASRAVGRQSDRLP